MPPKVSSKRFVPNVGIATASNRFPAACSNGKSATRTDSEFQTEHITNTGSGSFTFNPIKSIGLVRFMEHGALFRSYREARQIGRGCPSALHLGHSAPRRCPK